MTLVRLRLGLLEQDLDQNYTQTYLSNSSLFFPFVGAPLLVNQALSSGIVICSCLFEQDGLVCGMICVVIFPPQIRLQTLYLTRFPFDRNFY